MEGGREGGREGGMEGGREGGSIYSLNKGVASAPYFHGHTDMGREEEVCTYSVDVLLPSSDRRVTEMSSVFLEATRGCPHQPWGEGAEMTKSRDPHFTLIFSGKYSPT